MIMRRTTLFALTVIMLTAMQAEGAEARSANPRQVGNWLAGQDKNGDGRIAKDEATGLMKRFFDRNDTDKNGFIDEAELQALSKRLGQRTRQEPQQEPQRQSSLESIMQRVPKGVKFEGDIAYRRGNDAWKLDLAMPAERGSKARPAIVFVHGGGWRSGDKRSNNFLGPALEFAAKGYVCITVNYRMLDEVKMPDIIADVKCAVRWLRAHSGKYNIDPDRIGAYGNSAGAHLVTMLGLCPAEAGLEGDGPWQDYSSMVQAVVASATPTGWVLSPERQKQSDERRKNRPATGNDTRSLPLKIKKQVSPTSYISADAPPMLFVHDNSDSTVPVWHSDEFVEALRDAGAKDVTYMRYDNASGHGVFGRNIAETGPAREAFFERTLTKKTNSQPDNKKSGNNQRTRTRPQRTDERAALSTMPTFENISYGPDERNVLDFWQAKFRKPAPLVVYIHGGGFVNGSKDKVREKEPADIERCLANGVSFASISYRLRDTTTLDLIMLDCARAIQFLRYKSQDWNIDKTRFAAYGSSAGGGASLWLAVRDDLADPKSKDPVLRESSRLTAAGHQNSQATYDCEKWAAIVGVSKTWQMDTNFVSDLMFYGTDDRKLVNSPKIKNIRRKIDMLSFMDAGDPPLFLHNPKFDTEPETSGDIVHHQRHAKYLKKKCDEIGIQAVLVVGETPPEEQVNIIDFFFKHLNVRSR